MKNIIILATTICCTLLINAASAQEKPTMENLLRMNSSIDPLIQQRDNGLNALAVCQGDLKTLQEGELKTLRGKLAAAEAALKEKGDQPK